MNSRDNHKFIRGKFGKSEGVTRREEQILRWIKENPMISQQELANRAGISRSGMAAHISNLMKKGYIAGKGYVVCEPDYVVVIGGANIDICGMPFQKPIEDNSNPGTVLLSYGGAGRNVAHNLVLLGIQVKLITAFGDDIHAPGMKENCRKIGMDINDSLQLSEQATSTYLFITDEHGEIENGVSDMEIHQYITPEFIRGKMELINRAAVCVVDANIPQDTIEYLMRNCMVPVFAAPVSATKAMKLKPMLSYIHTLKSTRIETEILTGIRIKDERTMKTAAERLLSIGVKEVYISLGTDGMFCCDGKNEVLIPYFQSHIIHAMGSEDGGLAALVWAYIQELGLEERGKAALAVSAICMESKFAVNSELCEEMLQERMKESQKRDGSCEQC